MPWAPLGTEADPNKVMTMRFYSETIDMPETTFQLIRDLIHERTGLLFENGRRELLADKLSSLVVERGFQSFLDYYYLLKYDDAGEAEWDRVMNALSVQETYFWREMDQIKALVEEIVPAFFAAHPGRALRIWSAACATGEEPISIAMALNEAGWLARGPIQIVASDASENAIARARAGKYGKRSFRTLPEDLRRRYFTPVDACWQVSPELHSRIRWRKANLMAPGEVTDLAQSPVIFCRNVFIYFSESSIGAVVNRFFELMPSRGYLMVGASESLFKVTKRFDLETIGGAFVYVKD
jgi:chemotaxis protein methyltransferase CheR